jgi:hypothetical protein
VVAADAQGDFGDSCRAPNPPNAWAAAADWRGAVHRAGRAISSRRRLRENANTYGARRATVFIWAQFEANSRPYLQIIVVDAAVTARFRRNENFIADNIATQEAKTASWVPKNYTAGGELGIVLLTSRAHW